MSSIEQVTENEFNRTFQCNGIMAQQQCYFIFVAIGELDEYFLNMVHPRSLFN